MSYVAGDKYKKIVKKPVGTSNTGNPIYRDVLVLTCHECDHEFEPTERKLIGMKQKPLRPAYLILCPKCKTKQKDL